MNLFNKKLPPACEYCEHGNRISESEVICRKKGVVYPDDHCSAYKYAPLKRKPDAPPVFDMSGVAEALDEE